MAGRARFWVGGGIIGAAIVGLIATATLSSAQYFLTVAELRARTDELAGEPVRVSGAVLGDSIRYDADAERLSFTVVNMPADSDEINALGGLAAALEIAVKDVDAERLEVVYQGIKPDLLRHEAQAIMTGQLGEDGVFYAEELLLKCPTRYEAAVPEQTTS